MDLGFELFTLEHFMFAVKNGLLIAFLVFFMCFSLYGLSFVLRKMGYGELAKQAKNGSNNIWAFILKTDDFIKGLFTKDKG